jgi:hypothetical protein
MRAGQVRPECTGGFTKKTLCNGCTRQQLHVKYSHFRNFKPPQRCLHLVLAVGLVRLCDPESKAGGSLTTSRATHAGKVKGNSPD